MSRGCFVAMFCLPVCWYGCAPAGSPEAVQGTAIPILGSWKGFWSYSNGLDTWSERFQMTFSENRRGVIAGNYVNLDSRRQQRICILKTSPDRTSYRMTTGEDCWNVMVRGSEMKGVMNGGPCTAAGVGSAARLIEVQATRISSSKRPE